MTEQLINKLDEFVIIMYDQSSTANRVSDTRVDFFARKQQPYNGICIYTSRAALVEYIKRSV